jgi:3-keto-L-gulonate-6-phosphate decarboxylase
MRQKIQFALDIDSIQEAERYARELSDYWDILEIGTILLLKEGISCVKVFREIFQEADILVDTKIIDSGSQIAALACSAGADIITVLSAASEKTITHCVETAHSHNCMVLVDHLSEDWESQEFYEKCKLGVDFIGLHIPKDI